MCMPSREEHREAVWGNWGWQGFCVAKTCKTACAVVMREGCREAARYSTH